MARTGAQPAGARRSADRSAGVGRPTRLTRWRGDPCVGARSLVMVLAVAVITACSTPVPAERPYLTAATDAAAWIRSARVDTAHGRTWPVDPTKPDETSLSLYSGSPGVVLFFLDLHRAGHGDALADARAGADHLLGELPAMTVPGLYSGIAGVGFALGETWKATGDDRYRAGVRTAVDRLHALAVAQPRGIQWNGVTDIVGGGAGTGLFLLYAGRLLDDPDAVTLAEKAGERLLDLGIAAEGGTKWFMDAAFPRLMPNFAHGTAGIAYFFADLYRVTRRQEFLDAALAGAGYLLAVAQTDGDVCLIFHNEPDGIDLHYLSWCHGPAGTARLFYLLHAITGDGEWMQWMRRSARAIMQSGIPDQQTPGFWNNVSMCCGSAGVADFFVQMHHLTGDAEYLAFARRVVAQMMEKGTRDEQGLRWVQAEHRVRPELLVAQTGYMQGAAGMGTLLLRMDAVDHQREGMIRLPDDPYR
jgi:lantibiotic modifying enzyme